jgi:thymidylate synthase (FAD)
MPRKVPIEVFRIGHTTVDRAEMRRWLDFLEANDCEIPEEEAVSNPALLIAMAAKRCYKSFEPGLNPNVTKIRADYGEYLTNVLNSGHGSVLEHSVYTWAIENVSRVFTGEMNRHRAGMAISEGSMRFIRYTDIPYWEPTSISGEDVLNDGWAANCVNEFLNDAKDGVPGAETAARLRNYLPNHVNVDKELEARKQLTRETFRRAFKHQQEAYQVLQVIWDMDEGHHDFPYKKKVTSMMRRIIGMGVATGGVWTGNIRSLRHIITMRCSPAAEEEILLVFSKIAKKMVEMEPLLFGDFEETEEGFWAPKYIKV